MTHTSLTIAATASTASIEALERYARDFIGYGMGLGQYFAAADLDPTAPLIQAYAGALHMGLEARVGHEAARPYLVRALTHATRGTADEQCVIGAILDWAQGHFARATQRLLAHTQKHPHDLMAAKWGQYLAFNLGSSADMLAFGALVAKGRPDLAEAHGMHAFGLEQTHQLDAAETAGRRALALKRSDAWAQHAVAHVMETQGRVEEGLAFLRAHSDTWTHRSVFMRQHNWWHVALFHLDLDQFDAALDVYDQSLWGEWPEFGQEQIGAVSALWRLELRGVNVGRRWEAVGAKIAERGPEHVWPFHDMHYVYGLARAGLNRPLRELLASMERKSNDGPEGRVWSQVALPLAHGLVAHAEGRKGVAANMMASVLPKLQMIGGSHAQRDVFVQTWMDSAIKAGEVSAARRVLQNRLEARPNVPVTRRLLELCGVGEAICA